MDGWDQRWPQRINLRVCALFSLSAELLTSDGVEKDGRFLVRRREQPTGSDMVLSLVFRGKPAEYRITKDDSGHLVVDEERHGDHRDIGSVRAR